MYLFFISLFFFYINLCLCIYRFNFSDLFEIFQKKKDASRLFNLVFCFNNFTLYAIDFSKEGIEMVFSGVD